MANRDHGRIAALALAAAFVLTACGGDSEYVPAGIIRTPPPEVGHIVLPDAAHGEDVALVAEPDGLLLVYFGYTACPDICPTTMADVRKALRNLDDLAKSIDVAMITVDPNRDTPEVISAYVQAFVPDGIAITTLDEDLLAAAAEPFGAIYSVTEQEDGWIDVVHSAFLYAVDDQGRIQLTWPFGTESDLIEADLRAMLDGRFQHA